MYYLDLSDEYVWLIKCGSKRFHAGFDKGVVENLVARLNEAHRPNIEERHDVLYVCWNLHDKGDKCEWVAEITSIFQ